MNVLWEGVKATAGIVGQAAVQTGKMGKLQTELVLINREIDARKRAFGEELYDYVEPLSKHPDFFAASDRLTSTLIGPLLTAQREIAALEIKRANVQGRIAQNDATQKTAFVAATNMAETLQNTAKKAGFVSIHAKLKTEMSMVEVQILDFKQVFGLEMFQLFVDLEDMEGWLPTVRDIRSIYDNARRDVSKIYVRRKAKEDELIALGGTPMTQGSESSKMELPDASPGARPSYFDAAAKAELESNAAAAAGSSSSAAAGVYTTSAAPAVVGGVGGYGATTLSSSAPPPYGGPTAAPAMYSVSNHSTGGADWYGSTQYKDAPTVVQSTVPQQQQQQVFADPFSAATTTQQPPPSSYNSDPFASSYTPTLQQQYPSDPFVPVNINNPDPFATTTNGNDNTSSMRSSFGGSAPMGGNFGDPFGSASGPIPPQSDDPFAGLSTATQSSSSSQSDNPMFRF